tara:strand:+ start:4340 stop:4627 length:288 start_codon:yes stop_codon:yes gene_type:complete
MPNVVAKFVDSAGQPLNGLPVEISPRYSITVKSNGDVVVPIRKTEITDDNGNMTTSLEAGDYALELGGVVLKATIPDQESTVNLSAEGTITNATY